MKKPVAILAMLACVISAICFTLPVQAAEANQPSYEVIYRVYNPNSGEHLYTISTEERDYLSSVGWEYEGLGWVAPKSSGTPIYRVYNGIEHLYTTDNNEVNVLVSEYGWSDEGIKFFSDDAKPLPMYRLYNPNGYAGAHHYTRNPDEKDMLVNLGWNYENIAWYASDVDPSDIPDEGEDAYYENTIENTNSYATIEADVKLTGSGSGYHAKLLFQTPKAAVSFGIQYDRWAAPPYTDTTFYLCENIASNDSGGQHYTYHGTTYRNMWHHIMITYSRGGVVAFYVDGDKLGEVTNPNLEYGNLYFSAEGSARLEGDSVEASFKNIKLKTSGYYNPERKWHTYDIITNPGFTITKEGFNEESPTTGSAVISGTIQGIGEGDWDSAYESVSGVLRFGDAIR